jgi:TonB-linked SusC/RagA family outer membrane protein
VWAQTRTITGTVADETGEAMPFVTVGAVGATVGTVTDINGRFSLTIPQGTQAIRVSFIGFKTQDVTLTAAVNYTIRMESEVAMLEQVVIVGNVERNRESFTGAFSTVSGSELKQMGSQNLVESLKSLDPSFVVMENLAMGANPNAMPIIEVRGQTSINLAADLEDQFRDDPNQPLFILDGFETTLQKIIDLDPNRIESVSVLKDAASTAFYGSRAANGVVVVTTTRGEVGRFRAFYTADYSVQIPNLTSYNMMDAEEKLRFELLSGRYTHTRGPTNITAMNIQNLLDSLYNDRLMEVRRGVNTYWMSDPLRTPLTHRQSVRVSGGTDILMTDVSISYRNAPGVMKGSGRESWSSGIGLTFRHNNFTLFSQLELNGFTGVESPYGNFSNWVRMNPYYRRTDEYGEYPRLLDQVISNESGTILYNVYNPLYVASLNHKNETRNTTVDERLRASWDFYKGMRLEGMVQLSWMNTNMIAFIPPEDPRYDDVDDHRKGSYSNTNSKSLNYTANLMYVWRNRIGKHDYVVNARGEMSENNRSTTIWRATGYPFGTNGNPSFANNYVEGKPDFSNPISRRMNLLFSGNYAYDGKYLFDATIRYDGSTVFGSARKFTPFWATGIGWNIHRESFMRPYRFINNLRLRATIGVTGNQNIASTNSSSIYAYLLGGNVFGPGVFVNQLGNPNIEWQKTLNPNLALDLTMFNDRLVTKWEIYQKRSNPLVVTVSQAPSTGITAFPMSLGILTSNGFEYDVSFAAIRTKNVSWRVRVMGSMIESKYSGFNDRLSGMDIAARNSGAFQRFQDGYGPRTIFAVRSLGIDPATGNEMFLKRDGVTPTFLFDPTDELPIGEGSPKVMGVITSFLTLQQLTFTFSLRYSLKEMKFNRALFDKVENISMNEVAFNQDRRALYDRWQTAGDISQFKSINLLGRAHVPQMTSRFIQTESFLSGESIGVTWRCKPDGWIRHLGMSRLDVTATFTGTSGVFRLSNIQTERGTSYPEATNISVSISAAF